MHQNSDTDIYGKSRKLAAILFADVVGYSKLMHADEDEALEALDHFKRILSEEVHGVDGQIVKNYGDGCLCLFKSAVQALHCAKSMQIRLRNPPAVPIRIGIHIGDIIEKDDDIFGDGINIASRLESMGQPGTVFFSKSINDKVRNHKEFKIEFLGKFLLKNIEDPIQIYALANEGFTVPKLKELSTNSSVPLTKAKSSVLKKLIPYIFIALSLIAFKFWNDASSKIKIIEKSIAVLPFHNDSDDPSNDYFCNGMMEDILTQLQKIGDLKVISRSSVMPYKDTPKPIRMVANELDVGYVLEGSVRKSGNQVLVTTQLINGKDESQVWANRYDEKLTAKNIFEIQGTIANNIATQLEAKISPDEQRTMDEVPTDNLEAYDNYLRGMYFYNDRFSKGEEYVNNAIKMFQIAIDLDSTFAKAHLRLAYSHDHIYWVNIDGSDDRANLAKRHFEKAFQLDPDDPEIREGQGWYQYHINADYDQARKIFSGLSSKFPKMSTPLNALGVINGRLGNWREAEDNFERSIALDPTYISTHLNFFYNLIGQRKFVRAKNYLDRLLNISPENSTAHREMTNLIIMVSGNVGEALEYYENSGLDDHDHLRYLLILSRSFDHLLSETPTNLQEQSRETLVDYALINYYTKNLRQSKKFATAAIDKLETYTKNAPHDYMALSDLAMMYGLAGQNNQATNIMNSVTGIRSIKKDALLGPQLELQKAKVLNVIGRADEVISILNNLMSIPSSLTVEMLQVDPIWDNLRNNAEFNKMMAFQKEIETEL